MSDESDDVYFAHLTGRGGVLYRRGPEHQVPDEAPTRVPNPSGNGWNVGYEGPSGPFADRRDQGPKTVKAP